MREFKLFFYYLLVLFTQNKQLAIKNFCFVYFWDMTFLQVCKVCLCNYGYNLWTQTYLKIINN